ncbi:MAG: MlaD family protein [Bryobacteraceae bacterium]|nr:MlaD family protein [Bryobacteraceae bacterium]
MALSAKNQSWTQLRVGLTAIFALAMLGVLIFFMTSNKSLFSRETRLYTYFVSSGGISAGQPVRLNGILAGKVDKVELSGDSHAERTVRITMLVDNDMLKEIPVDSTAQVGSENLLSGRYLALLRGVSKTTIAADGEIKSKVQPEIDDMKVQGLQLLESANSILAKIEGIVKQVETGQGTIGKLLVDETLYKKVLSITAEIDRLTKAVNSGNGLIGKMVYDDALYTDLRKTLTRVDTLVADVQEGKGTAGKLLKDNAVYDETRAAIVALRKTIDNLNAGQGTAGKLLRSDELHNQLSASMKRLDTTIDKINSGQGTIGQLLVNASLYDNLNGTAREMQGLMKDFRANPKKFLHIKLGLF